MLTHSRADHLKMMRDPNRWPCWPLLPLHHRTRAAKDGSGGRELGFLVEAGMRGEAAPKVYIGLIQFGLMGQRLSELPTEEFPTLEALVDDGWEVD